ncbi:MAG: hypothetical protein RR630_09595 [Coprobacillus sp.]
MRRQYRDKVAQKSFEEKMNKFPKYDTEARKDIVLQYKMELIAEGICRFKDEKRI